MKLKFSQPGTAHARQDVLTDATGHFAFRNQTGNAGTLKATLRGFKFDPRIFSPVYSDSGEDILFTAIPRRSNIAAPSAGRSAVIGQVTGDGGRVKLAGVEVDLRGRSNGRLPIFARVRTGAQGEYAIENLPPGSYRLWARLAAHHLGPRRRVELGDEEVRLEEFTDQY